MTTTTRKQALEATLSKIAGQPVEITIRGENAFTFSTDEVSETFVETIRSFFGKAIRIIDTQHDEETGTFVYTEAA